MLLMIKKGYIAMQKKKNKIMINYDKNMESVYLMYLDENNLYGWAMSQKLPVEGFKWEKIFSNLNKNS